MPTILFSKIKADADQEYGDLKIAMTDELDEAGEPRDFVALRNSIRLGRERRARMKELLEEYRAIDADHPDVEAQRAKVNAAQNRLDTAGERTSERARVQLQARIDEETKTFLDLQAEHEPDQEAQADEIVRIIGELIRAVAANTPEADRLIAATKTQESPDGDLPYLMQIFTAYREGAEVGEASPSES